MCGASTGHIFPLPMSQQAANCPNCGALVHFRWSGAVQTTCEYCRSILVRRDVNLEKVGEVAELPHDHYNRVPDDLVAGLNDLSATRRKADPKFQKQDQQIKKYLDRKARHSISLSEAKFRSEYVPEDPEEKAAEEKAKLTGKYKGFKVSSAQVREIAKKKFVDLNARDEDHAVRIVEGTARSMGLTVEG